MKKIFFKLYNLKVMKFFTLDNPEVKNISEL